MIAIFTDIKKSEEFSDTIHKWLLKNRKDYQAERWSDVLSMESDTKEYYVKIPPDYEVLNAKIELKEKLILPTAKSFVDKLPDNWKA
jgi:hypothetical protein